MNITDEILYESAQKAEELWLDTLPLDIDLPEHRFSARFNRKMKKLMREQQRSPRMNKFIHVSKRVALIALTTLTVTFSCLICVEAYRTKFIKVITEIFEDLTKFSFSTSGEQKPKLGELMVDYLPEGMSEVYRDELDSYTRIVYFQDTAGRSICIEQGVMVNGKQSTLIVDTEDAEVTTIDFKQHKASLIVKGEHATLMWEDGMSTILVSGDFPMDEIIKVASGIFFCR